MTPTSVVQIISQVFGSSRELAVKTVATLVVLALIFLLRKSIHHLIRRKQTTEETLYYWNKVINYTVAVLIVVLVGGIWLSGVSNLATFLGLLSAGIAIALKEPIVNFAAWIFIILRRNFIVGDRIEIESVRGDVIDIRPFSFSIMEIGNWVGAEQSTGRIIHFPNAVVFSRPVANYTQGFEYIWDEIPVLITFESDWRKAKQIVKKIVDEQALAFTPEAKKQMGRIAGRFFIKIGTLTPRVYTSVEDSGILLSMRFLTPVRQRRGHEEAIWESLLQAFEQEVDIDFAYPTQRVYYHPREGKPGTGGPAAA
ncbi:MAG: mechanosensitive ion channel family protein [Clostridia bacterium]|nr:MAG: mechanosensitive ion channel family protein [Clostridia bacterium]